MNSYVLQLVFNKIETDEGPVYWRECVQQADMLPDSVGYVVVWPNGDCLHTYNYPPNFLR